MIVFTDQVLTDIGRHIATHEPERGGALLGIPFTNVICRFLSDPEAHTSHVVYRPSPGLQAAVQEQEILHGLQFFGIVHSHPGSFSEPSSQDHVAFLNALDVNPHLSAFVAPIVTLDRTARSDQTNEVPLDPRGRLTSYIAYRPKRVPESDVMEWEGTSLRPNTHWRRRPAERDFGGATVVPMDCSIMPIGAHIASVVRGLAEKAIYVNSDDCGFLSLAGSLFQTETIRGRGFDAILMFPPTYPFSKPFLLFTDTSGVDGSETRELEFRWPFGWHDNQVLWTAIGTSIIQAINSLGTVFIPTSSNDLKFGEAISNCSAGGDDGGRPQQAAGTGTSESGHGKDPTGGSKPESIGEPGRTNH